MPPHQARRGRPAGWLNLAKAVTHRLGRRRPGHRSPLRHCHAPVGGTAGVEFPPKEENKRTAGAASSRVWWGRRSPKPKAGWSSRSAPFMSIPNSALGGTPDFWVWDQRHASRGVLQAKTAGPDVIAKQWDDGRVPPEWIFLWQLVCEMYVTDAAFGVIAVFTTPLIGIFTSSRSRVTPRGAAAHQSGEEFWHLVDAGIEPTPDFERDAEVIKALIRRERPAWCATSPGRMSPRNARGPLRDDGCIKA